MIFKIFHFFYVFFMGMLHVAEWFYNYSLFKLYHVEFIDFPRINGRIFLRSKGCIAVGSHVMMNSRYDQNPIGGQGFISIKVFDRAVLTIGKGVGITNSAICCAESITIEDEVFIGGDCSIYDTDFHSISAEERLKQEQDRGIKTKPVVIKSRAFIGASCIILKGVTIGENSIIGAGSVVTKSIPNNEVWGGNPAHFLRHLRDEEITRK